MFDEQAFHNAMNTKYGILGQQANADTTRANAYAVGATAQANLTNKNAAEVAANAASQRGLQDAQAGLAGAQTGLTNADTAEVHANAVSHRGLEGHQGTYFEETGEGNLLGGQAALQNSANQSNLYNNGLIPNYQAQTRSTNLQSNQFEPGSVSGLGDDTINSLGDQFGLHFHAGAADVHRPLTDPELHMIHQHLCMGGMVHAMGGMSQVPGQSTPPAQVGTQASDQVPAMLAPNEAVLNSHAADIIGRDKIAAANAIGNHMAKQQREHAAPAPKPTMKGMIEPKDKAAPGRSGRGYAEGSSNTSQPNNDQEFNDELMKALQNSNPPRAPDRYWPSNGRRDKSSMMAQKLAGGTHQVAHGKSAKTPTKIDPAAALQLLQMARGGAGMPAPVQNATAAPQGSPMPMQPSM